MKGKLFCLRIIVDHSFSMYVCVSGGRKCKLFGKFCVRTKLMIPWEIRTKIAVSRSDSWLVGSRVIPER